MKGNGKKKQVNKRAERKVKGNQGQNELFFLCPSPLPVWVSLSVSVSLHLSIYLPRTHRPTDPPTHRRTAARPSDTHAHAHAPTQAGSASVQPTPRGYRKPVVSSTWRRRSSESREGRITRSGVRGRPGERVETAGDPV